VELIPGCECKPCRVQQIRMYIMYTFSQLSLSYNNYIIYYSIAPTAVRDLKAMTSSSKSINISWNHPQYPNSKLTYYIIYYRRNPPMIQVSPNILNNGFVTIEVSANNLSLNLLGLDSSTNYAIHMSVRGEGVSNAPIETEVYAKTNDG